MKIVVLDGYTENPGDLSWDVLREFGELTVYDRTPFADEKLIRERIVGAEIVITNKTPLSRETIQASEKLQFIAVLATGYNVVDTAAAKEMGVPVANVPTYGTAAVAQYTIALLLEICHHVALHDAAVREGRWENNIGWCFWDRPLIELAEKTLGEALGQSAQAENLGVLLGPAANIKRSPLCGRNFEYFSEDPYLSGETAAAYIRGVQKQGVGTSLKHFAVNNQETRRMSISAEVSERALREIYLASFEHAVKGGKPWTVMCSYNKINGVYSSENEWLLTEVLRDDWGFNGVVMTDWGAINDHVKAVKAGLKMEMPRAGDDDDQMLVDAVRSGELDEEILDRAALRMLELIDKYQSNHRENEVFDRTQQHELARRIGRETMVLLKNDHNLLPVSKRQKIAFIGAFAEKPRFQGGGSSHINCSFELSALEAVRSVANVTYAKGFCIDSDNADEALEAEAVKAASEADVAVLFLGLPERIESESYDRSNMSLPACQNHLVEVVAAVQKNIVIVLHNGSPVEMPWVNHVNAILEAYLGGQAVGGAVVDLLFGIASPCAKLAETFPMRLQDTPCYLSFPGGRNKVEYGEGIYVGYRYYDKIISNMGLFSMSQSENSDQSSAVSKEMLEAMTYYLPLHALPSLSGGAIQRSAIADLIQTLNQI